MGRAVAVWRLLKDFPQYEVSDRGGVRNRLTGREIAAQPNDEGYLRVRLFRDGKGYWHKVGTIVLQAFVGPRPSPRHHCAHTPDRTRTNNRLCNLRWATPEENEADKDAHGTKRGGGRHRRPTKARIARIRTRVASGESYTSIAKSEGLHRHSISRIARGLRRAL